MRERLGIVDVGGGMRGIYAAGALDYCLDNLTNSVLGSIAAG